VTRLGLLRLAAALVLALGAAAACLVPPFDPTGKSCALPAHPCPDGFDCIQGRCAPFSERLVLTAPPAGIALAGTCGTAEVVVRRLDGGAPGSDTVVGLEADGGMRLFSDTGCKQEAPRVTVPGDAPDASFSFFALRGGQYQIFATAGGSRARIDQEISPLVRSGRCSLGDGQASVQCPVTPAVLDPARSFAVFQTSTQEVLPADAGVNCLLAGAGALQCSRFENTGLVDVQWQVAEVPGASVQSSDTPDGCALFGGPYYFLLPTMVDPTRSFVLFSEHRFGASYGADDFSAVRLYDAGTVVVDNVTGCSTSASFAVQVVSLPGVSVTRGVAGPLDAGVSTLDVQVPQAAPQDRTILLHTHEYSGSGSGPICAKVVRGEVADSAGTTLHFSRGVQPSPGCSGPNLDIEAIAWERIEVPPGDRLQRFVVSLSAAQTETTVPIALVDPTRTLVFASGQGNDGQALGETRDTSTSDVRVAALALQLDPAGTSFRASRTGSNGAGQWTVYVWEFGPSP